MPSNHELQAGLGDLVALSALPGLLAEIETNALAEQIGGIVFRALDLDIAYVCVQDTPNGGVQEATKTGVAFQGLPDIPRLLSMWERRHDGTNGVHDAHTGLRLSVRSIGLHAEWGVIGAASMRPEFPTMLDAMKLQVIANYVWALTRCRLHRARLSTCVDQTRSERQWICTRSSDALRVIPSPGRRGPNRMTAHDLKINLQQLGLSQRQFATLISVSLGTVKKWCQGRAKIPGPVTVLLKAMLDQADKPVAP